MNRVLHSIGDMESLLNAKNQTSNRSVEPVAYCRHQLFEINEFKAHPVVEFSMKVDIKSTFFLQKRLQKLVSFKDSITQDSFLRF